MKPNFSTNFLATLRSPWWRETIAQKPSQCQRQPPKTIHHRSSAKRRYKALIRNEDGTTTALRGSQPQPIATDDYHIVSTRVVKEIPKSAIKPTAGPSLRLSKFKNMLKPPVVKAVEALPPVEGKTYHVDEEGRIIETTVRRAAVQKNARSAGGGSGA
ncbi:hypothetical protein C8034_v006017 [Colletotrichum sidae]|uniref:Uncharacterized protein n=1 Tax=Colletotrichum sidae TaxID=1347389 RepID=A0A4R8T6T1_9PEZI|nr:hypothetical protein C8034_v006017 [Colletotrichum sidae]